VHLVYQKLNKTKSFLELAMQADHFLVEHSVPIHARKKERKKERKKRQEGKKERERKKERKTRKN